MNNRSYEKVSETGPEMPKRFRIFFLKNDKNCSVEIAETEQLCIADLLCHIELGEPVFISQNATLKRNKRI